MTAGAGIEALFTTALGLQPPWEVVQVQLETARRRIDFEVRCSAKRLACPHCGLAEQGIHDRLRRCWRHLDFFQYGSLAARRRAARGLLGLRQDGAGACCLGPGGIGFYGLV